MQPRPFYEGQADRTKEREIVSKIEGAWNVRAAKLKTSLKLDYALAREGSVVAFAEVKARTYSWEQLDRMGGYMLSLDKWTQARQLCSGLPFSLVIEASGDLRHFSTRFDLPFGIVMGGRKDRADWQDVEPCILIPVRHFKPVSA